MQQTTPILSSKGYVYKNDPPSGAVGKLHIFYCLMINWTINWQVFLPTLNIFTQNIEHIKHKIVYKLTYTQHLKRKVLRRRNVINQEKHMPLHFFSLDNHFSLCCYPYLLFSDGSNILKYLFHIFSCYLKLFHQKVRVKYQLGALNTCLLVKNLINNIRKKFKVFQILFPPIFPFFVPFFLFRNDPSIIWFYSKLHF